MKEFLFLGDSITDCYHSFDAENLGRGYVSMIANYFKSATEQIKVRNMGVDGFTISALRRLWKMHCTEMQPDFITILIGINDLAVWKNTGKEFHPALEAFRENYVALLEEIQRTTDCPILLMEPFIFPHPAEFATWEWELREWNRVIQEISCTHHIPFLPLWDKLLEAAKLHGYTAITLDGVHLTAQGHRVIAEAWLNCTPKVFL